jgi:acyl CoA:acetate/3-ketoacid CoA transferase beta subunit
MSIASHFRGKMDVALKSADRTRGIGDVSRRAELQSDLDEAGLCLIEKEMVAALMDRARNADTAGGAK